MLPAMTSLVDRLLPDGLWQRMQPLLPPPPPRPRGGVPRRVSDRNCVAALVFMARTSTPWSCCRPRSWAVARLRPAGGGWMSGPRPGCSSSARRCCWMSGVRPAALTWSVSASIASACGRSKGGPDRRQPCRSGQARLQAARGWRRWRATLAVIVSAANANDATMFEAVLEDIPPVRMPSGRRRRRPAKVHADKAYDHRRCRRYLRRRGIRPRIARRMVESSARLGRHRWRIERTGAWLGGWRRLRIRYERSSERFYALVLLACGVICFNTLQQPPC
jgi:transposase